MLRAVPHPILVSRLPRILRHHQTQSSPRKTPLFLVDFGNRTGDPIFDETQKQGTGGRAGTIAIPNVVPDQEMGESLTLMSRGNFASVSAAMACLTLRGSLEGLRVR
jgi:hypothetical protein